MNICTTATTAYSPFGNKIGYGYECALAVDWALSNQAISICVCMSNSNWCCQSFCCRIQLRIAVVFIFRRKRNQMESNEVRLLHSALGSRLSLHISLKCEMRICHANARRLSLTFFVNFVVYCSLRFIASLVKRYGSNTTLSLPLSSLQSHFSGKKSHPLCEHACSRRVCWLVNSSGECRQT